MSISALEHKFKLKFDISRHFELWSFELTRFYCTCEKSINCIGTINGQSSLFGTRSGIL
jgi:hypothetical protein